MNLREAILPYTDEDGLVLERPNLSDGPETGNGIHGLCVKMLLLFKLGQLNSKDVEEFTAVIRTCEVPNPVSPSLMSYRGLYHRGPRKTGERISHDDYRMLASVSNIIGAPFAKEIAFYGNNNCWNFNNLEPGKFTLGTWHGRFPGFVALYKISGGLEPWDHEISTLSTAIWISSFSKNPGSWIIRWSENTMLEDRLDRLDASIYDWRITLKKKFPGGMRQILSIYYGPTHPFALYCPE